MSADLRRIFTEAWQTKLGSELGESDGEHPQTT